MAEDHFLAILGLIGTLSGTAIGFAGGLITQVVLERNKNKEDRRKKRVEKFEELISAIYDYQILVDELTGRVKWGSNDTIPKIPLGKALAIARTYFPQFESAMNELAESSFRFLAALSRRVELMRKQSIREELDAALTNLLAIRKEHEQLITSTLNKLSSYSVNSGIVDIK
jgi:hypothetical protein